MNEARGGHLAGKKEVVGCIRTQRNNGHDVLVYFFGFWDCTLNFWDFFLFAFSSRFWISHFD